MENYFATCIKNHNFIDENTVDLISLTKNTSDIKSPHLFQTDTQCIMLYYIELLKDTAETFF